MPLTARSLLNIVPSNFGTAARFGTLAVHAGHNRDIGHGALATPIFQTAAFELGTPDNAAALFNLEVAGHVYSRISNPTVAEFEERVAILEGGVGAVATASGQAALHLALITLLGPGGHIVASSSLYGGSHDLLKYFFPRYGITTTFVNPADLNEFESAIRPETRLVFTETVSNPNLRVADIPRLADIAHRHSIPLMVDSTLTTPFLMRPIALGADIVMHSATKYLGGHGAAVGGVLIDGGGFDWAASGLFPTLSQPFDGLHGIVFTEETSTSAFILRARREGLRGLGACLSPFNAFLISYGMQTLPLRMVRHVENANRVAEFLEGHRAVEKVHHPSLPSHPDHERAAELLPLGAGAVLSMELKGGIDAGQSFIQRLRLIKHTANIGDVRSLVIHPASTTHFRMSTQDLRQAGVSEGLVRLALGIEDLLDLIEDIEQALQS
jgi:O-acetylhomoserine (thiol)-lyase